MIWTKKGLIIRPRPDLSWMVTHASSPVAELLDGDSCRIYFYGRDRMNRSQIGYAEIDLNKPQNVAYITEEPVLGLGPSGAFDESGVMPSWLVDLGDRKYLYYTGWTQGVTVTHYFYVGLAVSRDGGRSFERVSPAPILERNSIDPYLTASPTVLVEDDVWRMWYVSSLRRTIENGKPSPHEVIRYAESTNGLDWKRTGLICIDISSKDETAVTRPCVVKDDHLYKMWYSVSRSGTYRIGYAESEDGMRWKRKDGEAGIDVSPSGWDSEMIEYPFVFEHRGRKHMFYNGNGYGKTGLGYAVSES